MNVLFICSRNRLRSPTAEAVFASYPGVETASAGTSLDAEELLSLDLIEWADLIFVMERVHRTKVNSRFSQMLKEKKIIVLNIPDQYSYMDPALIALLEKKVTPYLGSSIAI